MRRQPDALIENDKQLIEWASKQFCRYNKENIKKWQASKFGEVDEDGKLTLWRQGYHGMDGTPHIVFSKNMSAKVLKAWPTTLTRGRKTYPARTPVGIAQLLDNSIGSFVKGEQDRLRQEWLDENSKRHQEYIEKEKREKDERAKNWDDMIEASRNFITEHGLEVVDKGDSHQLQTDYKGWRFTLSAERIEAIEPEVVHATP
jgi:hypothetical protein